MLQGERESSFTLKAESLSLAGLKLPAVLGADGEEENGESAAQALAPVPSPAPSPAASAAPGATILAASIPNLSPNSTYTVTFTANQPTQCVEAQSSGTIGSFTTQ